MRTIKLGTAVLALFLTCFFGSYKGAYDFQTSRAQATTPTIGNGSNAGVLAVGAGSSNIVVGGTSQSPTVDLAAALGIVGPLTISGAPGIIFSATAGPNGFQSAATTGTAFDFNNTGAGTSGNLAAFRVNGTQVASIAPGGQYATTSLIPLSFLATGTVLIQGATALSTDSLAYDSGNNCTAGNKLFAVRVNGVPQFYVQCNGVTQSVGAFTSNGYLKGAQLLQKVASTSGSGIATPGTGQYAGTCTLVAGACQVNFATTSTATRHPACTANPVGNTISLASHGIIIDYLPSGGPQPWTGIALRSSNNADTNDATWICVNDST